MPRSGEQTRQRILDAAERLFAERGIGSVSLREINTAAGQRNNSALHYHFDDRDGVLRAMADRHMPAINARQAELFAQAEESGRIGELDVFVDTNLRPFAEYLRYGASARAWIIVASELAAHPRTDIGVITAEATPAAVATGAPVFARLAARTNEQFALHRIRTLSEAALHVIADRARHEDAADRTRELVPLEVFIEDLLAMMVAALDAPAPVSAQAGFESADPRH